MSCYSPLKAVDFGINPETGKHIIKVVKSSYNLNQSVAEGVKIIPIPCGNCIGCRLDYSRTWADRCMCEAQEHDNNIFLTLTYDDKHLPECLTSSVIHPLQKKDIQRFMKRLRKRFPEQKIRYFAAGEYSPSMRPHYHLLIFGLKLPDLKLHHKSIDGKYLYYISDIMSDLWQYGFHIITDLTWETCAYTARYVMKKQKGNNSSVYDKYNYTPEFTLMSRKPGIGYNYFKEHSDIVKRDYYLGTDKGSRKIKSNRYFDKLFDLDYPGELELIKEQRQEIAVLNNRLKCNLTSLSYKDMLHSEEINKAAQIKALKRKEF